MKNLLSTWGLLLVSVLMNAGGVFLIKFKMNEYGAIQLQSFSTIFDYFMMLLKSATAVSGLVLFVLAPLPFAMAISRMDISIAYPAQVGLNFAVIMILALLFLGETMTLNKCIGLVLVIASVYFLLE